MDGHMYPIGGKECLEELRKIIDPEKTKIVIHSGDLIPDEIEDFKRMDVSEIQFFDSLRCLSYPLFTSDLILTINGLFAIFRYG
jgi:hypothetical protein